MKKYLVHLAVLGLILSAAPASAGQSITVYVKGMVCDLCARGLNKGFKEKSALESFKVELSKHTVTLNLKDGANLTDSEITKVVEDSSMAVDKIIR